MIHPTAIIHEAAIIGQGCLRPYCVIVEHVQMRQGNPALSCGGRWPHANRRRQHLFFPFSTIGMQYWDLKWEGEGATLAGSETGIPSVSMCRFTVRQEKGMPLVSVRTITCSHTSTLPTMCNWAITSSCPMSQPWQVILSWRTTWLLGGLRAFTNFAEWVSMPS